MEQSIIDYTSILQEILSKLDLLAELNKGIQTLTFIGGCIIALLLVNLFAKAWGRNT